MPLAQPGCWHFLNTASSKSSEQITLTCHTRESSSLKFCCSSNVLNLGCAGAGRDVEDLGSGPDVEQLGCGMVKFGGGIDVEELRS